MGSFLCGCLGPSRPKIPEEYLRPQGLYSLERVDLKKLRRLIQNQQLAPCHPGVEELAPGQDLEECPICFLHYPVLNSSLCCQKRVCTECFLQVQTSTPPHQLSACPFCKVMRPAGYLVKLIGARTAEEKEQERVEEQKVIEARIREREEELRRDQERALQRQQQQQQQQHQQPAGAGHGAVSTRQSGSSGTEGDSVAVAAGVLAAAAAAATPLEPSGSPCPAPLQGSSARGGRAVAGSAGVGALAGQVGSGAHYNTAAARRNAAAVAAAGVASGGAPGSWGAYNHHQHHHGQQQEHHGDRHGVYEADGEPRPEAPDGGPPTGGGIGAVQGTPHRRNQGGGGGRRYRLTDYVPAGVVDIAMGLDDINDLMLEQAMYESLAAAAATSPGAEGQGGDGAVRAAIADTGNDAALAAALAASMEPGDGPAHVPSPPQRPQPPGVRDAAAHGASGSPGGRPGPPSRPRPSISQGPSRAGLVIGHNVSSPRRGQVAAPVATSAPPVRAAEYRNGGETGPAARSTAVELAALHTQPSQPQAPQPMASPSRRGSAGTGRPSPLSAVTGSDPAPASAPAGVAAEAAPGSRDPVVLPARAAAPASGQARPAHGAVRGDDSYGASGHDDPLADVATGGVNGSAAAGGGGAASMTMASPRQHGQGSLRTAAAASGGTLVGDGARDEVDDGDSLVSRRGAAAGSRRTDLWAPAPPSRSTTTAATVDNAQGAGLVGGQEAGPADGACGGTEAARNGSDAAAPEVARKRLDLPSPQRGNGAAATPGLSKQEQAAFPRTPSCPGLYEQLESCVASPAGSAVGVAGAGATAAAVAAADGANNTPLSAAATPATLSPVTSVSRGAVLAAGASDLSSSATAAVPRDDSSDAGAADQHLNNPLYDIWSNSSSATTCKHASAEMQRCGQQPAETSAADAAHRGRGGGGSSGGTSRNDRGFGVTMGTMTTEESGAPVLVPSPAVRFSCPSSSAMFTQNCVRQHSARSHPKVPPPPIDVEPMVAAAGAGSPSVVHMQGAASPAGAALSPSGRAALPATPSPRLGLPPVDVAGSTGSAAAAASPCGGSGAASAAVAGPGAMAAATTSMEAEAAETTTAVTIQALAAELLRHGGGGAPASSGANDAALLLPPPSSASASSSASQPREQVVVVGMVFQVIVGPGAPGRGGSCSPTAGQASEAPTGPAWVENPDGSLQVMVPECEGAAAAAARTAGCRGGTAAAYAVAASGTGARYEYDSDAIADMPYYDVDLPPLAELAPLSSQYRSTGSTPAEVAAVATGRTGSDEEYMRRCRELDAALIATIAAGDSPVVAAIAQGDHGRDHWELQPGRAQQRISGAGAAGGSASV